MRKVIFVALLMITPAAVAQELPKGALCSGYHFGSSEVFKGFGCAYRVGSSRGLIDRARRKRERAAEIERNGGDLNTARRLRNEADYNEAEGLRHADQFRKYYQK